MATTIQISDSTKDLLCANKVEEKDTYEDVILDLFDELGILRNIAEIIKESDDVKRKFKIKCTH